MYMQFDAVFIYVVIYSFEYKISTLLNSEEVWEKYNRKHSKV